MAMAEKLASRSRRFVDGARGDQRTAGWKSSLRIGAIRKSLAISRALAAQNGSLRSALSGAGRSWHRRR